MFDGLLRRPPVRHAAREIENLGEPATTLLPRLVAAARCDIDRSSSVLSLPHTIGEGYERSNVYSLDWSARRNR